MKQRNQCLVKQDETKNHLFLMLITLN